MDSEQVIQLSNVSKTFRVRENPKQSIRELVTGVLRPNSKMHQIKALQNINLEIHRGETFGIIGRNGSGKSTLLHLIMGAMKPDKGGEIKTNGKMMRLALGMGVDPNLSARENIYVNGSILGLTFKEIGHSFYDMIDFAGLGEFIDTPVKYYSKGMKQRLLFTIAMHAESDIFLLDEFFGGVGDEDFRKKSDDAFKQRILEGKTIVIVSHAMAVIKKFCKRAVWIDKGIQRTMGDTEVVIKDYMDSFKVVKS